MLTLASSAKLGGPGEEAGVPETGGEQSIAPGVPTGPGKGMRPAGLFPGLKVPVDLDGQQWELGAQGGLKWGVTVDQGLKGQKDSLRKK